MSDNSEMVDAEETPPVDVIDDSCTVQYIEITPLDRPSDDCYKQECIDPVVEVKLEDVQDVKQQAADETLSGTHIPEIFPLDRPSDDSSGWLSATGNCYQLGSIESVVEVKLEDLPDVKQLLMKLIIQPSSQRHYRVIEHLTIALSGCLLLLIATSWEVLNQLLKSSQKTYKM